MNYYYYVTGCHRAIVEKIRISNAYYILAVKDNQAHLLDDIKEAFAYEKAANIHTVAQSNLGNGRIEKRTFRVIIDMDWICCIEEWTG